MCNTMGMCKVKIEEPLFDSRYGQRFFSKTSKLFLGTHPASCSSVRVVLSAGIKRSELKAGNSTSSRVSDYTVYPIQYVIML